MVETGGWGGIGHYAHCLSNALAEAGCNIRLATHASRYELGALPRQYSVEQIFQGDGLIADWRRLFSLCRQYEPELVHFQSLISTRRDCMVFRWMAHAFPSVRRVVTVHNVLPHELAIGERWAFRSLYRAANGLVVHSQASLDSLCEMMGTGFDVPVAVIPHGHYGELVVEKRNRKQALESLHLSDHRYLTCFGAIRPYKGVDWLLRTVAGIHPWPRDMKVLVMGHLQAGVCKAELLSLQQQLGLEDRVVFRFGYVPEEKIPDVFTVSDIILLPYRHIDQSGVLMAALAAGKPVVCTPVGAFPEVVTDEVGFLSDAVSCESFHRTLLQAIEHRDRWPEMGRIAREMAERQFGWDNIASKTIHFYHELTAGA